MKFVIVSLLILSAFLLWLIVPLEVETKGDKSYWIYEPIADSAEVDSNVPEVVEVAGIINLQGFRSMNEASNYIKSTGIPAIRMQQQFGFPEEGKEDWDCDDYAIALAEQAIKDGKKIGLAITIEKDNKTKVHMTNFVIIDNRICKASAQTGMVVNEWQNGLMIKVD